MRRLVIYICAALTSLWVLSAQEEKDRDPIAAQLQKQQYDLSTNGKAFLLKEARQASFFLLGELHGENEIPALLRDLWPPMWRDGYRYIAGELTRIECANGKIALHLNTADGLKIFPVDSGHALEVTGGSPNIGCGDLRRKRRVRIGVTPEGLVRKLDYAP